MISIQLSVNLLLASVLLVQSQYYMNTIAGNGEALFSGDGGPATDAGLNDVSSVIPRPDNTGVYIAGSANHRVRFVDVSGIISTLVGTGLTTYNSDTVPATSANLNIPRTLALDSVGNLYIANTGYSRIRKLNVVTNIVTLVAGNGAPRFSGDGLQATAASIREPKGMFITTTSILYFADQGNNRIRTVNLVTGIIRTIIGDNDRGYSGENGPASLADIDNPYAVWMNTVGVLYFSDKGNRVIRQVDQAGIISLVAGTPGLRSYTGDGGPLLQASFVDIRGIWGDPDGNLLVCDYLVDVIRKLDFRIDSVDLFAGNGDRGFNGDNNATLSELNRPAYVYVDKTFQTYFGDTLNNRARQVVTPFTPTFSPTSYPSSYPSLVPTEAPHPPTSFPTSRPSAFPSLAPSAFPTSFPTSTPSFVPTVTPGSNNNLDIATGELAAVFITGFVVYIAIMSVICGICIKPKLTSNL